MGIENEKLKIEKRFAPPARTLSQFSIFNFQFSHRRKASNDG
jgi:hypothetical protein